MESGDSKPKLRPATSMNGLEREFAAHLDELVRSGVLAGWRWRLLRIQCVVVMVEKGRSGSTWYTPDFVAFRRDGSTVVYETKGYERPEGIRRLKEAAAAVPQWDFFLVKKCPQLGGWSMEMFKGVDRS